MACSTIRQRYYWARVRSSGLLAANMENVSLCSFRDRLQNFWQPGEKILESIANTMDKYNCQRKFRYVLLKH
jgi:hypothetical protein